jgi:glycosyltransferase involved in cell wall biosynthesis
MTHIGIDARITAYRQGGISTYTRRLVEALARLDYKNSYTVFHSQRSQNALTWRFPAPRLWTPPHHRLERLALSVELLRYRLNVFHSVDFIPPWRGAKHHVITVHDLTFLHFPQHKDKDAIRYYNDQIEMAVTQADHILSVSEATKTDLITLLDVSPGKITVQPHGVEPNFKPMAFDNQVAWARKLNLPENYVLFVGTLEPRKNIETLLDAYTLLINPPPLLLVGRMGWLFDETWARIQVMQAKGYDIIHRDDIDDDGLPAVYNGAAALVLPSHYEGFGLPALEAMACGVPVVASDNSSLPEVVGGCGLLVDPNDADALAEAIERAMYDGLWRKTAILNGKVQAALFTWENSARIARAVYEGVMTT